MNAASSESHRNLVSRLFSCGWDEIDQVLERHEYLIDEGVVDTFHSYVREQLPEHEFEGRSDWIARAHNIGYALLDCHTTPPRTSFTLDWAIAALEYVHDAYAAEGAIQDLAHAKADIGQAYAMRFDFAEGSDQSDLDRAADYLQDAIDLWVVTKDEDKYDYARFGSDLGNVESDLGNYDQAIRAYREALDALTDLTDEEAAHQRAKIHVNLAEALHRRGEYATDSQSDDFEDAIEHLEEALHVYTPDKYFRDWAWASNILGIVLANRIEGQRADNIEQAIEIFEEVHRCCASKETPDVPYLYAEVCSNLGGAYSLRIEGERAVNLERCIEYGKQCLQIHDDANTPETQVKAPLINLGIAYEDRIRGNREENIESAIQCYEDVLERLSDTERTSEMWARVHTNLGNAHTKRIRGERAANYERAIDCFEKAGQQWERLNNTFWHAHALNNLGNTYKDRKKGDRAANIAQAIEHSEHALSLFQSVENPYACAEAHVNLGEAYVEGEACAQLSRNEEYADRAAHHFREALSVYRPHVHPGKALTIAFQLGKFCERDRQWKLAQEAFADAIKAVELLRERAMRPDRKTEIMEKAFDAYVGIVETCIERGRVGEAMSYAEQSRARVLADLLHEREIQPSDAVPKHLIEQEKAVRKKVRRLLRRIQQAVELGDKQDASEKSASEKDSSEKDSSEREYSDVLDDRVRLPYISARECSDIREELRASTMRWHDLQGQIGAYDPAYRQSLSASSMSTDEITQFALRCDTAIVEWYKTHERLHAFIVAPGSNTPDVKTLSIDATERLYAVIERYQEKYKNNWRKEPHRSPGVWLPGLLDELADLLSISSIVNQIPETCTSVVLIPHRSLHLLPLHALPIRRDRLIESGSATRLLAQRFEQGIWYAPSVSLARLGHTTKKQQQEKQTSSGSRRLDSFWAVENPTEDLSLSETEVADIQHHFSSPFILSREEATKSAVLNSELQGRSCIHFACHGLFDAERPLRSHLRLAGESKLTLGDIFELPLETSRLTVLSACESGLTDIEDLTDEYVGLPSGFLFAGSQAVLSSLWPVSDVSTALLMMRFYEEAASGQADGEQHQEDSPRSLPKALHSAQQWLRRITRRSLFRWIDSRTHVSKKKREALKMGLPVPRQGKEPNRPFSNPYYWAGFRIVGC